MLQGLLAQVLRLRTNMRVWLVGQILLIAAILHVALLSGALLLTKPLRSGKLPTHPGYAVKGTRSLWYIKRSESPWASRLDWSLIDSASPSSNSYRPLELQQIWHQNVQFASSQGYAIDMLVPAFIVARVASVERAPSLPLGISSVRVPSQWPLIIIEAADVPCEFETSIVLPGQVLGIRLDGRPAGVGIVLRNNIVVLFSVLLIAVSLVIGGRVLNARRRVARGQCSHCGYAAGFNAAMSCPECGYQIKR